MDVSATEAAWLAGFFDGEGYVSLRLKYSYDSAEIRRIYRPRWTVAVRITNTHRAAIERVAALAGGPIVEGKPQRLQRRTVYWWGAEASHVWACRQGDHKGDMGSTA
jgi:hypothetical protein